MPARVGSKRSGKALWVGLIAVTLLLAVTVVVFMVYNYTPKHVDSQVGGTPYYSYKSSSREAFALSPPQAQGSVVYLYMDGCIHCKNFKPVWEEFTRKYKGPLQLRKIEASQPEAQQYNVRGYPSVLLVTGGGNPPRVFNGQRTVDALLAFARSAER